jgi:hypothetical protein
MWPVVDYFDYAARPVALARRVARCSACRRLLHLAQAHRRILHLHRASGCFGMSHGLSRDSSSATSPHAGSSSTNPPTPRVRVPRLVAGLVMWPVVYYFASTARPGASARRAARHRLLRLRRASGCLSSSRGSSSTTSPPPRVRVPRHVARLVVDYFDYAARPVASIRRATCRVIHRRLLRLTQARRRLLRLRRTSGCLGTSRGSSCRSPSTTSPTPRVRVPRHVAWLVTRLVVDYSVRHDFILRPHWLYFSHAMRRGYLSCGTLVLHQLRHASPQRRLLVASRRPFISTSFPN